MRKVVCNAYGPLEQLTVEEAPDLQPGPGQVVVDVEAAGVNFVDALVTQGLYQVKTPPPFTPGSELAGVVSAVAPDVEGVEIGRRVLALPTNGGYASQALVAAASLVTIPDALSAGQAAGIVQSYGTMHYAYTYRAPLQPGQWVAVLGAGGGIGLAAVDLAVAAGAHVVACASSEEKLELARSVGATAAINYEEPGVDLKAQIREVTGGGADVIADPIGGDKAESALRALRWEGRYLVLGFAAGDIPRFPINQVLLNSRSLIGIEWGAWVMRGNRAANDALIAEVLAMAADGRIHPVEPTARPLNEVGAALTDLQQRRIAGKVVLTP